MDESLLPAPAGEERPVPWRAIAAAIAPFAALAAGAGLSRAFDPPSADGALRWLFWSTGAGLAIGAVCGALLRRLPLWVLYGACAPGAAVLLASAGVRAARPVRERLADRAETKCRASGRALCTAGEFRAACARGDRGALGVPAQTLCVGGACTFRWTYAGPFRPDGAPRKSILLCSVTTDDAGTPRRSSVIAVALP